MTNHIIDLPKQTASPLKSLRGYGCKFHTTTGMVQLFLQHSLSPDEIKIIFDKAVKLGYVLDNAIPTTQTGWCRSYVKDSVSLIALTGEYFGRKVSGKELSRGVPDRNSIPLKYTFMEIEYNTDLGSHFALGDWVNGEIVESYNPWPALPHSTIRTVRYWRIFETI